MSSLWCSSAGGSLPLYSEEEIVFYLSLLPSTIALHDFAEISVCCFSIVQTSQFTYLGLSRVIGLEKYQVI